jgi:hypothetical protein
MCESDSGVRRDDGRKNEFNTLIAAMIAAKMCESDSGGRRDPDLQPANMLKVWAPTSRLGEAEASLRRSQVVGVTDYCFGL